MLDGEDGDDVLFGEDGSDTLRGGSGNDTLDGGAGDDKLGGKLGNDILKGGAGRDQLWGDDGNDVLSGGLGNDTLTGGTGRDVIVFGAANSASTDVVTDFSAAQGDRVGIVASDYGLTIGQGLTADGALDASWLIAISGTTANQGTANGHGQFLFNSTTRTLSWDVDGVGEAAGMAVATFDNVTVLSAASFQVSFDGLFIS